MHIITQYFMSVIFSRIIGLNVQKTKWNVNQNSTQNSTYSVYFYKCIYDVFGIYFNMRKITQINKYNNKAEQNTISRLKTN